MHRNKSSKLGKMRQQKLMFQAKEKKKKTSEKELHVVEISNLSDKELKAMILKILKELEEQ